MCHPSPIPYSLFPQWRDLVTEGVSANLSFLKDVWLWYCVPLVQMLMRECVHSTSWCSISVQKTNNTSLTGEPATQVHSLAYLVL